MNAGGYPKRSTHFAHKLVRLMLHSCAAQEIGPDGFLVVTAIAHAEDAKRYSGPVTYWNEQLLPILGFGSWGQLDRARKRAIEAGWLHYECGGKGKVGKYWATVPSHLVESPDVSTEADHHVSLSNSGEENVKETGKKRERTEGQTGDNRGTSGEHSTLCPNPTPLINMPPAAEKGKDDQAKAKAVELAKSFRMPKGCDTPEHRGALRYWLLARFYEHGTWYQETTWEPFMIKNSHWTPEQWMIALTSAAAAANEHPAEWAVAKASKQVGLSVAPKSKTKELTAP